MQPKSLHSWATEYALSRGLADSSAYQLLHSVRRFSSWLGRAATPADLTSGTVSEWIQNLEQHLARRTVAGHRINLLSLWHDLSAGGICEPPRRVRVVRRPEPLPVAWTQDELSRIVAQCERLSGKMPNGVERRTYALGLVLAAYDTGLRRSDLWALERRAIRPDGSISILQRKTARPHQPRLRQRALELIASLPGDRPMACPYRCRSAFYRWWRRDIIKPAGVRHGALQQLRRTGATHLAIEHRSEVQRYLGHASQDMQRFYIDESLASPITHLPPEIAMSERAG